jgi:general secretion pathway protein D
MKSISLKYRNFGLVLLAAFVLQGSSCESLRPDITKKHTQTKAEVNSGDVESVSLEKSQDSPASVVEIAMVGDKTKPDDAQEPTIYPGSGEFVRQVKRARKPKKVKKGDVTLNFQDQDLREVVKIILGDMLKVNYILDPNVRGGVTMQTGKPLPREALLSTLETLLRMNNAAVVKLDNQYRVLPAAKAHKGIATPQLADAATPLPAGYGLKIVALEYISAIEMGEILKPLVPDGSVIRVDPKRNLLILAGTGRELRNVMDVIYTFDVDWVKGLSVGFFVLQNTKVEDVQKDLDSILGGEQMLDGLIRVTPIESANGLLAVTSKPYYLEQLGIWIKRLDVLAESGGEERLFVYRVKNGEAESLADILNQLYQGVGSSKSTTT